MLCNAVCTQLVKNITFIYFLFLYKLFYLFFKCPYYGLWKVHILVLGVPSNMLTCMQGQKTLSMSYNMHLFLPYLLKDSQTIHSTIHFSKPLLCVTLICGDWSDWSVSFPFHDVIKKINFIIIYIRCMLRSKNTKGIKTKEIWTLIIYYSEVTKLCKSAKCFWVLTLPRCHVLPSKHLCSLKHT